VIKKFFTRLTEPLVPYAIYNKIMGFQNIKEEDEVAVVDQIVQSLPSQNRKVLLYLIDFIKKEVLQHENNKMNYYSMSVCLSPCFFRP
jgi:Rho GTPase-activating protein 1